MVIATSDLLHADGVKIYKLIRVLDVLSIFVSYLYKSVDWSQRDFYDFFWLYNVVVYVYSDEH